MKTHVDCIPCLMRQALQVARLTDKTPEEERLVILAVAELLKEFDMHKTPPELAIPVYDKVAEMTGVKDPYYKVKRESNEEALKIIETIREEIKGTEDELIKAARFCIAGNIIDFGASGNFDLKRMMDGCLTARLAVDQSVQFCSLINNMKHGSKILYLLDNCGEIVYDTLLLDLLKEKGADLTMVVRSSPIINDAIMEDALFVGLDKYGKITESGAGCPGTALSICSPEFLQMFEEADLVISKGQGNFETLSEAERSIIFLLTVKCDTVGRYMAEFTGVNPRHLPGKGEMAIVIT